MVQLPKGKSKQREPPPVLFVNASSTTASTVPPPPPPVAGQGAAGSSAAGVVSGSTSLGGAPVVKTSTASSLVPSITSPLASSSAAQSKLSSAPTLPSLQRTTTRLRHEVAGTTGAGTVGSVGVPLSAVSTKVSVADSRRSAGGSEVAAAAVAAAGGPAASSAAVAAAAAAATKSFSLPLPLPLRTESTRATDRSDALWSEMQATLEEIELSASEGTRVFGPDHDRKLAELRHTQIALAQAWARSEADDAIETTLSAQDNELLNPASAAGNLTRVTTGVPTSTSGGGGATKDDTSTAGAGAGTGTGPSGTAAAVGATTGAAAAAAAAGDGPASTAGTSAAGGAGVLPRTGGQLEEETQVDILLARKRREANDRYFQRVSEGVLDVVAKLEEVADSMRAVEQESKDIWGDNESEQHNGIKA